MTEKLVAKMVYLPVEEVVALQLEAEQGGRNGVSQQIRHALAQRRRLLAGEAEVTLHPYSEDRGLVETVGEIIAKVRQALL